MTKRRSPRRRITHHPLSAEDVHTIVTYAMAALPEELSRALDDVEIVVVADHAVPELVHVRDGEGLPLAADFKGYYAGTTLEGDDAEENPDPPSGALFINAARHHDEEDVTTTLYHEIGHALGLTEDEVSALGLE